MAMFYNANATDVRLVFFVTNSVDMIGSCTFTLTMICFQCTDFLEEHRNEYDSVERVCCGVLQ